MKYRYKGSGFVIDVVAGEPVAEAIKRLNKAQPNVSKPGPQELRSQVRLVSAIEQIANNPQSDLREELAAALREIAAYTHGLVPA
jgi:hypothetical protein